MATDPPFATPRAAASDPRIVLFGRLLGAANGLEHILGRALEEEAGIEHTLFELLLVVGRGGPDGVPVGDIARARVLTSGGATRLVHRAVALGLVRRSTSTADARVQLIVLTAEGEASLLRASALHARNIERLVLAVIPEEHARALSESLELLSKSAQASLRSLP